jgi:hypothetical protein
MPDLIRHPEIPLKKEGITPLWQRGARGDFEERRN